MLHSRRKNSNANGKGMSVHSSAALIDFHHLSVHGGATLFPSVPEFLLEFLIVGFDHAILSS
jgi:hypothetical protein